MPYLRSKFNRVTFLEEGTHTFTPTYGTSAFRYPSKEDRFNASKTIPSWAVSIGTERSRVPLDVDIVMCHGPTKYILDGTNDGNSVGGEHLRRAVERVQPKSFCFRHVHTGYGAQRLEFDADKANHGGNAESNMEVAKEWGRKNQAKRKGDTGLPPGRWRS
jgi:hypothetical protein